MLSMASNHHESHGSGYGENHQWMGMGGYPQSTQPGATQMQDYHQYDYAPPAVPMEPSYNMPTRPTPHYGGSHPLPPPPLIMPHTALWPSMYTGQPSHQIPLLPAAPVQTPISATATLTPSDITPTSAKSATSRRKLTDDERRQMCVEAEQNPGMKQTQIGAKFNVERSTVSKILRQKDKYMKPPPKEESTSPIKKSKVKLPDVERALANWVRNEQKAGRTITDDKLKKQARVFSTTSPTSESQQQITSPAWLDRFKQKNMMNAPFRRGKSSSINADDVVIVDSSTTSLSDTPVEQSPISSVGLASPPISPDEIGIARSGDGDDVDDFFNYGGKHHLHDTPSLEHVLSSDLDSSNAILSPVSPELLRSSSAAEDSPAFATNFSRQRSQTFPVIETEANSTSRPPSSHNRGAPAVPIRSMTSHIIERPISVDPRHTMKRHKSVPDIHDTETVRFSSMQPPPLPKSQDSSPILQANSPTPEEARQALHILKTFFQTQSNEVIDSDDYIMIGKLMEKLKVLKSPSTDAGSMHPIDMLDTHLSPRMSKKRTILGIST